jgi:hypothetical protein
MRKYGDHYTADLYDPWHFLDPARRQTLEKGWAGLFKTQVLLHLPVARIGVHFSARMGAPTKDLFVALGALILQQIHDLPDAQTVEAVAFNIAWQYALDIRQSKDANISERTIRNYRALLIEHGLDTLLFQTVTDRLIRAFKVDPTRQRIDSTVLRSAMRHLGRLGTLPAAVVPPVPRAVPADRAGRAPALRRRWQGDVLRRVVQAVGGEPAPGRGGPGPAGPGRPLRRDRGGNTQGV